MTTVRSVRPGDHAIVVVMSRTHVQPSRELVDEVEDLAWMVTSRAVVGSSGDQHLGSHASAMRS